MTDVRQVTVVECGPKNAHTAQYDDPYLSHLVCEEDPKGTHLLVPVEMVEWELNEDNDIGEDTVDCFASFYAKLCPTCGGIGEQHSFEVDGTRIKRKCPNCNGLGWKLKEE